MNSKALTAAAVVGLAAFGLGTQVSAQTLTANYFKVASGDPDFQTQCCSTVSDLVLSSLGPDGLPVLNPATTNPFTINDLTGAGGNEINWWRAADHVATGTVVVPIHDSHMFPPDGSDPSGNDSAGFLTAIFTGTLSLPTASTVTFHLGADDDAFLFVDGLLVDSLGGVHADVSLPVSTSLLTAGDHSLTLFYADRYQTQAQLDFSLDTAGVTLHSGVPEPAAWAMMCLGFFGLGGALRASRRDRRVAATA
jgi:fibro-slime domain-containing protein